MTFWCSEDNYGQILQCYALQKYLYDMGHDAYLIRYNPRGDYIKLPIWMKIQKVFSSSALRAFFLFKRQRMVDKQEKRNNPRNFEGFRNKYIRQSEKIYHSYKELIALPPPADIYIVGSDQIWNTDPKPISRAVNVINAFLLNFGDSSTKRISYAASFGKEKEELDSGFIDTFSPLLKKLDYVSVREKSGLEICKQCGINNAEWVSDPTILLDTNIYRTLYQDEKNIQKPDKPYIFLYLLGTKIDFSLPDMYNWAQNRNLEIVYLTGNSQQDEYKKTYSTIPEWIYLLEHAEYVITNSYHGTVFSILFKKKFSVIPRPGKRIGMNNRFYALFQLLKIESRFIGSDFSVLDHDIDWKSVADALQTIRNTCKLNEIISGKKI